jgi:hypothetical protein
VINTFYLLEAILFWYFFHFLWFWQTLKLRKALSVMQFSFHTGHTDVCVCVYVCVTEGERTAFREVCMIQVFAQCKYTLKHFVKYYAQITHHQWKNHQTRRNILVSRSRADIYSSLLAFNAASVQSEKLHILKLGAVHPSQKSYIFTNL